VVNATLGLGHWVVERHRYINYALPSQKTVRLRHATKPVFVQYCADTRRVGLSHLENRKDQIETLLAREHREQGMFGATGAATLRQHEIPSVPVRIPTVGETPYVPDRIGERIDPAPKEAG